MSTVSDICDAVGRKTLMQRLSVGKAAISNAVTAGKFPLSWYKIVCDECAAVGIDSPDDLFDFKAPSATVETGVGAAG